jgi:hypothetical protein
VVKQWIGHEQKIDAKRHPIGRGFEAYTSGRWYFEFFITDSSQTWIHQMNTGKIYQRDSCGVPAISGHFQPIR